MARAASTEKLTIDELARATGMTVRNIRAHQSRGLLPAPEVKARTGYYGPEHAARIRLIQEMQSAGFNLRAIERLIDASGAARHSPPRLTSPPAEAKSVQIRFARIDEIGSDANP